MRLVLAGLNVTKRRIDMDRPQIFERGERKRQGDFLDRVDEEILLQ